MRSTRRSLGLCLSVCILLLGCARPEDDTPPAPQADARVTRAAAAPVSPAERERALESARAHIVARADSVRRELLGVRGLSRGERADLRRDVNARQIATARALGVRAGGDDGIERLVGQGRLVELEDSTRYWVLRDLEYSVPYVTPDTKAMLNEIGRRFHERLDSLGIPLYRMEITSVLRTPETQAELRSRNANASRTVSAHEFGTTVDVAHLHYAAPVEEQLSVQVEGAPEQTPVMRWVEALVLEETARKHAQALQAELGRVLGEMRDERKLRVMMERTQAVYHMTVARRFPDSPRAE